MTDCPLCHQEVGFSSRDLELHMVLEHGMDDPKDEQW